MAGLDEIASLSTGGRLVYAVGDIHGRNDLLTTMMDLIADDVAGRVLAAGDRPVIVFLGDYIDRGPTSRQVIDQILAICAEGRFEPYCLYGNHEEAMVEFLDQKTGGVGWLTHGGGPTMLSYGVPAPTANAERERWSATRELLRAAVPEAHHTFLRTLKLSVEFGDFLFVHAGLRPGIALADQTERDMLWIRDSFLKSDEDFGKVVVHGHSPTTSPFIGRRRIGLDTGAYASGTLTAIRLDGREPRLLQAKAGARRA